MKAGIAFVALATGEVGRKHQKKPVRGVKDKFVPECESGKFRVEEIEELKAFIGKPGLDWTPKLDHQWGDCVMQGHRSYMEDRTVARSHFSAKLKQFSLYIVFDGHGGDELANHAQAELADFLLKQGENLFEEMENFKSYDVELAGLKNLLYEQFPAFDRELMRKDKLLRTTSGCTCTGVFLTPTHVIVFNVGDSRTLLIDAFNKRDIILFATHDHKPDNPEEEARINQSGGFVSKPPQSQIARVNGQLALSRAFGDFQLKMNGKIKQHEQAVVTDPDINIFDRSEVTHIVVGSDGLYDGLSNNEIAKIAIEKDISEEQRSYKMLRRSLEKGLSSDNMAAIVIDLNVPGPQSGVGKGTVIPNTAARYTAFAVAVTVAVWKIVAVRYCGLVRKMSYKS